MYYINKKRFAVEIFIILLTISCFIKFSFYIQLSSKLFSVKMLIILKSILLFVGQINLVQTLKLLNCIQNVSGSKLGQDINYPDCEFSWFYTVALGKCLYSIFSYDTMSSLHILYTQNYWVFGLSPSSGF
jgi:hypothetical protein